MGGMGYSFSRTRTPGGYVIEEVTSALQKSIRRGIEDEALFWATELDLAGYGNYAWKRIRIIASEDVGPAEPLAAITVRLLYENWRDQRREHPDAQSERLFLIHAVITLCQATKSRICDHAGIVMYEGERPRREIPDYALDKHTGRGRSMHRGADHFFDEGAKLYPATLSPDPFEAEARRLRSGPKIKREKVQADDDRLAGSKAAKVATPAVTANGQLSLG
jgi:replication-associated recombination protein RarA